MNMNEYWDVLLVYVYNVDNELYLILWNGGVFGFFQVNEYLYKENYYMINIYLDYFKQFDSGYYFKVMVGFNSEFYKICYVQV